MSGRLMRVWIMDKKEFFSGCGDYLFELWSTGEEGYANRRYYYKILGMPAFGDSCFLEESYEYFDTLQRARFAAIGHISIIQNGGC